MDVVNEFEKKSLAVDEKRMKAIDQGARRCDRHRSRREAAGELDEKRAQAQKINRLLFS